MDIQTFRARHGLSQADFAQLLADHGSPVTQGLISHWESGRVLVPPKRWGYIERATDGAVTRQDLRPDIWPPEKEARNAA